jgi:hypothetical protein
MAMTPFLQVQVLGLFTGLYVALHSGPPGPDGAANELTDANYVRRAVTFDSPSDADSDGVYQISNSAPITYPGMAGAVTVAHYSLWTALTGGNCLLTVALNPSRAVGAAGVVQFAIGELIVKGVTS